jgi:hypothetical protein
MFAIDKDSSLFYLIVNDKWQTLYFWRKRKKFFNFDHLSWSYKKRLYDTSSCVLLFLKKLSSLRISNNFNI